MPGPRFTVFESEENHVRIDTYYCLRCGNSVLMMERMLAEYPRRNTDGAYIVKEDDIKSSNVVKGAVKELLRPNKGAEKQYRMNCSECNVPIGYKALDIDDVKNEFTYIFPAILTNNPMVTFQTLRAKELAVPDCIQEDTFEGQQVVTVEVLVQYGAHTKVQVADVTRRGVVLQVREAYRDNTVKINETLRVFFTRMLDAPKGSVQLVPFEKERRTTKVAISKASCGYVYVNILKVMMDMKYVLPHMHDREAEAAPATRKRKREDGGDDA